jgi:organic radical activating enzyme
MTVEAFQVILSKIESHATFGCLFNWGEPFLNKSLLPMISLLHERGISRHIDSNLTLRDFGPVQDGDSVCENIRTAVPRHA